MGCSEHNEICSCGYAGSVGICSLFFYVGRRQLILCCLSFSLLIANDIFISSFS